MRFGSFNIPETLAALVIVALGGFMIWQGSSYPFGTVSRMGPGFFPVVLGILLMLLGAATVAEVRHLDTPAPRFPWRPFAAIMGGLIAFAVLAPDWGLVPATAVLVIASALGDRPFRPRAAVLNAAVLAALGYVVFVVGFGLPLAAFWW